MKVIGEPGKEYELTLDVPAMLDRNKPEVMDYASQTVPILRVKLSFCKRGEAFLNTGECHLCEPGSYLFYAHNSPISCLECPLRAQCYGGENIGPLPGYWR